MQRLLAYRPLMRREELVSVASLRGLVSSTPVLHMMPYGKRVRVKGAQAATAAPVPGKEVQPSVRPMHPPGDLGKDGHLRQRQARVTPRTSCFLARQLRSDGSPRPAPRLLALAARCFPEHAAWKEQESEHGAPGRGSREALERRQVLDDWVPQAPCGTKIHD